MLVIAGGPEANPVDPLYLAAQLGHTDPGLSLRVYASVLSRKDGEPDGIRALVRGEPLAALEPAAVEEPA